MKQPDIKSLQTWVYESHLASREERKDRWRDMELYDGGQAQWTKQGWDAAVEAGIDPVTVNRVFPVVNLILGTSQLNRADIVAKGRTQKDAEVSQLMSEAIKFILDQNDGNALIDEAFKGAVIPGAGYMEPSLSSDPRRERIKLDTRDWLNVFWDPFGSPWFTPEHTRYVFFQPWVDLDVFQEMYPDKAKDIEAAFDEFAGKATTFSSYSQDDLALQVEEYKQTLSASQWCKGERRRIRPVQMWYPMVEKSAFATFPDGRVVEITEQVSPSDLYQIMQAASWMGTARVRKMWTATFLGDLMIRQERSPYPHDLYPIVPWIGYIDRWGFPYGVPRQIRPQQEEVNKRRSMALALLKSRKMMLETDAVPDKQVAWEQAQRLDGVLEVMPGKMDRVKIIENQALSAGQEAILQASEREIQEVSGANDETLGYKSNAQSGVALDKKYERGITMLSSIFGNHKRSLKRLGEICRALVQGEWTGEKVLRITDSLTSSERFVELNKREQIGDGVFVRNDITQGMYDIIISDQPAADTVREANVNLLMEVIKRSPAEMVPGLVLVWLEMLNLPNKEQIMLKVRPLFGEDPATQDMSPEEMKQKAMERVQSQQQQAEAEQQYQQQLKALGMEKLLAEIEEVRTRAYKNVEGVNVAAAKVQLEQDKAGVDAFGKGVDVAQKLQRPMGVPLTPPAMQMPREM